MSKKFCRTSAELRAHSNGDSDFVGFLMLRKEHQGRVARIFSIAIHFPKLDRRGSISVLTPFSPTLRRRRECS